MSNKLAMDSNGRQCATWYVLTSSYRFGKGYKSMVYKRPVGPCQWIYDIEVLSFCNLIDKSVCLCQVLCLITRNSS